VEPVLSAFAGGGDGVDADYGGWALHLGGFDLELVFDVPFAFSPGSAPEEPDADGYEDDPENCYDDCSDNSS
jgi:hypothetical protein